MICQDCRHHYSTPNGEWCDIDHAGMDAMGCTNFEVRPGICMPLYKSDTDRNERVDHPPYYQGNIEVIDFIEDKELGFHLGNAIKYIARAGKKTPDAKEDIEKAIWYLERYLNKCK